MYTINFVNQNPEIATPWITFVQATQVVNGSTQLVGPALNANGSAVKNGVSYSLASINNTLSMDPTDWQGHLYISDAALDLPTSGGLPVDPAYTLVIDKTRYQMIEFAGSPTRVNTDITYINWYAIPLQMESTSPQDSGGNTRGAPKSQAALSALFTNLAGLNGDNPTVVVKNSNGNIVRVISPNAGNPNWLPLYPSFGDYINAFSSSTESVLLQNTYNGIGAPPSLDFQPQTYSSTSVTYKNSTLTIAGSTNILGSFTMISPMDLAAFNSVIYLAVMNYAWSYSGLNGRSSNPSGNTGDNNVFSAISRDLLAGFAFGFINSAKYGNQPSSDWQEAPNTEIFDAIQPGKPFYNPWANALNACFSDVYTFPFNDFLKGSTPELGTNTGDVLTITLLHP